MESCGLGRRKQKKKSPKRAETTSHRHTHTQKKERIKEKKRREKERKADEEIHCVAGLKERKSLSIQLLSSAVSWGWAKRVIHNLRPLWLHLLCLPVVDGSRQALNTRENHTAADSRLESRGGAKSRSKNTAGHKARGNGVPRILFSSKSGKGAVKRREHGTPDTKVATNSGSS